jgi:hypothetical protein
MLAQFRAERVAKVDEEVARLKRAREDMYGKDLPHLRATLQARQLRQELLGQKPSASTAVSGMSRQQLQVGAWGRALGLSRTACRMSEPHTGHVSWWQPAPAGPAVARVCYRSWRAAAELARGVAHVCMCHV